MRVAHIAFVMAGLVTASAWAEPAELEVADFEDAAVLAPPRPQFEYAVRCVHRGSENGVTANYKLKCTDLGSEVEICSPLEFEACRLRVVNDMGRDGWRYVGTDDGLGPSASVTFERQTRIP